MKSFLITTLAAMLLAMPAASQALPGAPEVRSATPGGQTDVTEQGAATVWSRANLLPDPGGIRAGLAERGLTFGLSETSEVFGNASGGTRRGVVYEGLTQFGIGLDTEKAFGWSGGIFNASGYQIHGRGLSANALGNNLQTVSSLEAQRGTLLFELWYEQTLFDKTLQIKLGQMAADQEFMVTQYGGLFTNHTFGWSTLPSTALPSGGPAYPLGALGVRLRWYPRPDVTVLGAVFNADPSGPGGGSPQDRNPSGTAFRLGDGVFAIAELQYARNQGEGATGLPGTFKVGGWYNSARFSDQRQDAGGLSLADPSVTDPRPRQRRNDWSLYAVVDQLVWRRPGETDGGIGVFARVMGVPGDRNLVNLAVEAGATWKGAIPSRASDTLGLAVGFARISDTASRYDADVARFSGGFAPIRRHETVLELTYQAQFFPWLQVQPTAQYIFNPGGGVVNPARPDRRLNDAAVFGLRSSIAF